MFTYGRRIKRRRIRHQLQTKPAPLLDLIYAGAWTWDAKQLDGRPHIMSALVADMLSCF